MRPSRVEMVDLGRAPFRVRHWGDPASPMVFMVHGWLDSAATFQFIVDAFEKDWHIVAPDLRGHGRSYRTYEPYFFMQLVADVDALLEHFSPHHAVRLVGHSLGANVSSLFAGSRPERVRCLVNLEGLAPMPRPTESRPDEVISRWLARLRDVPRNRVYSNHSELAARLCQGNPRLTRARANFLAQEFAHVRADGKVEFDVDPYQYLHTPNFALGHLVESCWPRIDAPVLLITGTESYIIKAFDNSPDLFRQRVGLLRRVEHVKIPGAGHNLQHEVPELIAPLIEKFFSVNG